MKKVLIVLVVCLAMLALIAVPALAAAQKVDLAKADQNTPGGGFVVFNAGAGANPFDYELDLKGVAPNTAYDIYLVIHNVDQDWTAGLPPATIATNAAGNANFHHNCLLKVDGPQLPGAYNVGVHVTLQGSASDLYLSSGFAGPNMSATVILK
jgi:hypothetical protein